jgi:hypothetical protein
MAKAKFDWERAHRWWQVPHDEIWRRAAIVRAARDRTGGPRFGMAAGQQAADAETWTAPEIRRCDWGRLDD